MGAKNVQFIEQDLLDPAFADEHEGQFDVVSCLEVVEHFKDPDPLIASLSKVLEPDGKLVLSTPYRYHFASRGEFGVFEQPGGHEVWGYEADDLAQMMEPHGLHIEQEMYFGGIGDHYNQEISRRFTRRYPLAALLATSVLYPWAKIANTYGQMHDFPPMALGVVARKQT